MPHLQLEYSSNVQVPDDWSGLFRKLHCVLHETGGIKLENCKSRARIADTFFISSGEDTSGFIHLDIRFIEGRTPEIKQSIGREIRDVLLDWFRGSVEELELQITIEIRDIEVANYFKYPDGTLTPQ